MCYARAVKAHDAASCTCEELAGAERNGERGTSMEAIQKVFDYRGARVRTVEKDGVVWFIAKDVCDVLDITNSRDAMARLEDDEKGVVSTDTPGGRQDAGAVNESGLYSLVLVSRKPEAKTFKRWITHEVLPAIRKTGAYAVGQKQLGVEDLIILQAQSVKELKVKVNHLEQRLDNLDNINPQGDKQQQLNAMVRSYAVLGGRSFAQGWTDFVRDFNVVYHTNLRRYSDSLQKKNGYRGLPNAPETLALLGRLDDGLRVAFKMVNRVKGARA
jgi:prophage antirepressor-like protein